VGLQAYVDDSGGSELNQHPYFVLAGLIADDARWEAFAADWKVVLDREPNLEYLKMSEAGVLRKQFAMQRGWTRPLRDACIAEFVEVIRSHAIFRISVSIEKKSFFEQVTSIHLRNPKPTAGSPYYLAFHRLVLGVPLRQSMTIGSVPESGKVDFIFDQQGKSGAMAIAAWSELKTNVLPKLEMAGVPDILPAIGAAPRFGDEKEDLPLQGADLFAWYMRRYRQRNRILIVPPDRNLERLFEIPGDDFLYDRAALRDVRETVTGLIAFPTDA
jgi:hypothetical protein